MKEIRASIRDGVFTFIGLLFIAKFLEFFYHNFVLVVRQ